MKTKLFLAATLALMFTLSSCKKDKEDDVKVEEKEKTSEFQSSEDNNKQQREFDDVMSVSFQALNDALSSDSKARIANELCASVSHNSNTKSIVVDFGEEGCEYNNITRKGKVIFTYTGHYQDSGSVLTISLDNYRVQNTYLSQEYVKVEGTEVISNKGDLEKGKTWSVEVKDAKITFEDGDVSTWESSRTRVLIDEGTASLFDEVYHVYGTASGVNRDGLAYTAEVTSTDPLVFDFPCWISKRMLVGGTITVKPEGEVVRSVDYGYEKVTGEACDRSVTITYGVFSLNLDL